MELRKQNRITEFFKQREGGITSDENFSTLEEQGASVLESCLLDSEFSQKQQFISSEAWTLNGDSNNKRGRIVSN